MKKIYLSLCILFVWVKSFAVGEIAIVAFQSDGTDTFSWVALVPIPDGTTILFTDKGWEGAGFRLGEGGAVPLTWVGGVAAGTVVTISGSSGAYTATSGTVTDGSVSLSDDGDQIFAFTGTLAAPNFLTGINFGSADWTYANNANTSALPAALTNGVNALAMGALDDGRFNCTGGTLMGSAATMSSAINTLSNWTLSSSILVPAVSMCTYTSSTLPVRLLSFKSEIQSLGVELTWQTNEEIGNSHFEVEKSSNAQNFEVIGRVNGQGTVKGKQNYSFLDSSPKNGLNYYRLKQVDFDGKVEYSRVIAAKFGGTGVFRAYPNPASHLLSIELPAQLTFESAQLVDLTGRKVRAFVTENLKLEGIENGIYLLKVITKEGPAFQQRIIKTN